MIKTKYFKLFLLLIVFIPISSYFVHGASWDITAGTKLEFDNVFNESNGKAYKYCKSGWQKYIVVDTKTEFDNDVSYEKKTILIEKTVFKINITEADNDISKSGRYQVTTKEPVETGEVNMYFKDKKFNISPIMKCTFSVDKIECDDMMDGNGDGVLQPGESGFIKYKYKQIDYKGVNADKFVVMVE